MDTSVHALQYLDIIQMKDTMHKASFYYSFKNVLPLIPKVGARARQGGDTRECDHAIQRIAQSLASCPYLIDTNFLFLPPPACSVQLISDNFSFALPISATPCLPFWLLRGLHEAHFFFLFGSFVN